MKWRLAESLIQLRKEVNDKWPQRSKVSDGTIGNAEHSARTSDHNPDDDGVVKAMDITHDPAKGLDSEALAQTLIRNKDDRIKYVISNKKIASGAPGPQPWKWRPYTGKNPHNHHVHVSVRREARFFDDRRDWDLLDVSAPATTTVDPPPARASLRESQIPSNEVRELQKLLGFKEEEIDGVYGPRTKARVIEFQRLKDLIDDGVVGSYTWQELLKGA